MKRTFAKRSLMSLVAGFFLFGFLLLSASRAEAQTIGGEVNWLQTDLAQQKLVDEVAGLYNDLSTMQPGTPQYNNKLSHAYYYRLINRELVQGKFIALAVNDALELVSGNTGGSTQPTESGLFNDISVDAALKQELKNDATNLLTDN